MADRFDKSYARRPGSESAPRRDDAGELPEDDPLVELARIVSGNESFDQILSSRYQQPAEPPRAAPAVRNAQPLRDASFDLEAELLNDLHSSFDPNARDPGSRPQPRAPEPAPARPAPRAAQPAPRADSFDAMALRPGAPAASSRPAAPAAAPEPYVAAPDFGRGRIAPDAAQRRPAPPPQPPLRDDDDYDDAYVEDDDLAADYDDRDDGYLDEPDFEEEKPRRSRKALVTAGVVLAVLVVGGLAAYALKGRTAITGGAPQVIAADESPTKVAPELQPAPNPDNQQNKLIYDRADPDKASPDQLQVPDDNPATDAAQSNESEASREISRIILPGGPGDQSTTPAVPGTSDAPAADNGDDAGPRKVRTVVVKPDGTIVSSEAAPRGGQPAADQAASATPPPAADAAQPAASAPAMVAPDAGASAAADQAPPAADATLPGTPAKDNSQLAAPAEPPQQVAAAPTVAPEQPAAEAPSSGGFVVQVTSQRSEAAAAAAYTNLQKKFPSVLGDRVPDIAKADLGAKGIYYRARVGPMATRVEAVNFCEQLRAAGGDCIVQKN